jgi:hypothetical protein
MTVDRNQLRIAYFLLQDRVITALRAGNTSQLTAVRDLALPKFMEHFDKVSELDVV